jgi:hypothetical protein
MTALIQPIIYPQPFSDESPIGYLVRVASSNAYDNYRWIISAEDKQHRHSLSLLLQYLHDATWSGFSKISKHLEPICSLSTLYIKASSLRFCPKCLNDAPYYRINWHLKSSVACIKHKCWLQDRCSGCGAEIHFRNHQFGLCHCGNEFYQQPVIYVSEEVIKVVSFLAGESPPGLANFWFRDLFRPDLFSLNVRVQLLHFLLQWQPVDPGRFSKTGSFHEMNKMSSAIVYAVSLSVSIFSTKTNFTQYLGHLHRDVYPDPKDGNKLFNKFYKQFYRHCSHSVFEPLKQLLEVYINEYWVYPLTQKNSMFSSSTIERHPWVSLQTLCREYEIGKSVIKRAIENKEVRAELTITESRSSLLVYRPDVIKLLGRAGQNVNGIVAAGVLGVTKKQFYMLIDNHLLTSGIPPNQSLTRNWEFDCDSLNNFVEEYTRRLPVLDEEYLSFPSALKWLGGQIEDPFLNLLDAVKNGEINAKKSPALNGLRSIAIEQSSLREWCDKKEGEEFRGAYSHSMLVAKLRLAPHVVSELIELGVLDSFTQYEKSRRLVSEQAVSDLKGRYALLSRLSKLLEMSQDDVTLFLQLYGVTPLKPEQMFDQVFYRYELINIPEIQSLIGSGEDWEV